MKAALFTASLLALPCNASAEGAIVRTFDGSFEDATFAVESAIVGKGLKIDYHGFIGDMLARTAPDVGAQRKIFDDAEFFTFCSAKLSRAVMEADPRNIAYCPYTIFVTERDGVVEIGFRDFPEGEMQVIEDLLTEIVSEALE